MARKTKQRAAMLEQVEEREYVLEPGDTLHFDSSLRHAVAAGAVVVEHFFQRGVAAVVHVGR